jgi:hypothetical protein
MFEYSQYSIDGMTWAWCRVGPSSHWSANWEGTSAVVSEALFGTTYAGTSPGCGVSGGDGDGVKGSGDAGGAGVDGVVS